MSVRTALPNEPSTRTGLQKEAGSLAAAPNSSLADLKASLKKALYENENKTVAETLDKFEQKTGAKREYLAYGVAGVLSLYLILGSGAELLSNLIGFAYPAYASVLALRLNQKEEDTQLLTYWTLFGLLSLVDFFSEGIMSVFPVYFLLKTVGLLYLSLPQTRGAERLYQKVLDPLLTKVLKDKAQ